MRRLILAACSLWLIFPASPSSAEVSADIPFSKVVVDLSEQRVYVYDATGVQVAKWKVSTGASDTPTPTGKFAVYSKSLTTFARGNPSVSMNHMVRFRGGVGFHGIPRQNGLPLDTPLGVRPVSHGCIRLSDAHAKLLYERILIGSTVIVRP